VAVVWASASIFVPSAKVMSWSTPPSLTKLTAYRPGAVTCTIAGSKPRSKVWTSMVPTGPAGGTAEAGGEDWAPLALPGAPRTTATSSMTSANMAPAVVNAIQ
jgi:hypothetical protein